MIQLANWRPQWHDVVWCSVLWEMLNKLMCVLHTYAHSLVLIYWLCTLSTDKIAGRPQRSSRVSAGCQSLRNMRVSGRPCMMNPESINCVHAHGSVQSECAIAPTNTVATARRQSIQMAVLCGCEERARVRAFVRFCPNTCPVRYKYAGLLIIASTARRAYTNVTR